MTLLEETLQDMRQISPVEELLLGNSDEYGETDVKYLELTKMFQQDLDKEVVTLSFSDFSKNGESILIYQHSRFYPETPHTHDFIEMFYIFNGSCIQTCNGESYHLQAGDFCFWKRNMPHKIEVISERKDFLAVNIMMLPENIDTLFCTFWGQGNIISQYFSDILLGSGKDSMIIFRTGDDRAFSELICRLYWEYKNEKPYYQSLICTKLTEVFFQLLREHSSHVYTNTSEGQPDLFLDVLMYIQENFTTVTLNEVCKRFHYSSSYLSRNIKRLTGCTFSEIILKHRMELSERLLSRTTIPITDIALKCGYCDSSYFSTVFYKFHNISPREYRKNKL